MVATAAEMEGRLLEQLEQLTRVNDAVTTLTPRSGRRGSATERGAGGRSSGRVRLHAHSSPGLQLYAGDLAKRRTAEMVAATTNPMPEPEPEQLPVKTARPSYREQKQNTKRNPKLIPQTPRLRAKAVKEAARSAEWPSKNVTAMRPPDHKHGDKTEPVDESPGPSVPGRNLETTSRVPKHKMDGLLEGLQALSNDAVVQRILESSMAGHSGSYIPKRDRAVEKTTQSRWKDGTREARHLVKMRRALARPAGADEAGASPAHSDSALKTNGGGANGGRVVIDPSLPAEYASRAGIRRNTVSGQVDLEKHAHEALDSSRQKGMFERYQVVSDAEQ